MGANSISIQKRATPSGNRAIVTADGTALAANSSRLWWGIQNLQTTAVYVKLGSAASSSSFDVVLKACTALNDGNGGTFFDDTYSGIVSIAAASGSPRVIVSEMNKDF